MIDLLMEFIGTDGRVVSGKEIVEFLENLVMTTIK